MKLCEHCNLATVQATGRRYCSRRCATAARVARQAAARQTVVCGWCRTPFQIPPSRASKGVAAFCSRDCQQLAYANRPTRVCPRCQVERDKSEFQGGYCATCYPLWNREYSRRVKRRWGHGSHKARKSGRSWTLTVDQFRMLVTASCHYCHGPVDETGVGLDRKDNDGGYDADNVVPCCARCNRVKGDDFSYDEMLALAVTVQAIDMARKQSQPV